jgi:predicted MFS family arabinose efflux permease
VCAADSRIVDGLLLGGYYAFRVVSLLLLPALLSATVRPSILVFVVIYGLDWVATVPPTIALCRELFGADGAVVFGWVFAAHQVGAALAAFGAGFIHDRTGTYTAAWIASAALCAVAAMVSFGMRRRTRPAVAGAGLEPAASG